MDVRQALIQAAIRTFAEVGMRGATTRRIAQAANVNEVTLFRHFKSKDDLLDAAFVQFAATVHTLTLPADPVDPVGELTAWCRAHHRELLQHRALIRKAMGEYEEQPGHCEHGMRASVRIAKELTEYLRRLRTKGLAKGDWDERAATAMLMGALFNDAMGRDTVPERYPYSQREAVDQYVRLLLGGIGATVPASVGNRKARKTTASAARPRPRATIARRASK